MAQVNQQLLAKRLNLSQTTVSRALANHPSINPDTKAQVWDLAAQLGYQISSPTKTKVGRGSTGEAIVIGILIAIPKKHRGHIETSQMVLRGIAEHSTNHRITLDILYREPSDDNIRSLQRRLRQNKWKGCILVHPMQEELVNILSKTIPCISVVENYRRNFIDSVDVDQIEAITTLVKRLHSHGHRKIGFLTWVYDIPTPWVYHRFGSYVETLFQLDLEFDPSRVINVRVPERYTPDEVADRAIAAMKNGTTAFVCAADHQAYDIKTLLEARGVNVPKDCSLTGFDGIMPMAGHEQIATVRVPYDEIGRSAFHQLLHRISFPTAPRRHVLVDGVLDMGKSIATVRTTDTIGTFA